MDRGESSMKYAMIKNGIVDNIIVADYTMAQILAQTQGYNEAVNCDNYPITIGDLYENGSFMNANDVKDELGNILIPARTVISRELSAEEITKNLEAYNLFLGQMMTDRELDAIEQGQYSTELELRILSLEGV